MSIGESNAEEMTHVEAQNEIRAASDSLSMTLSRYAHTLLTQSPDSAPLHLSHVSLPLPGVETSNPSCVRRRLLKNVFLRSMFLFHIFIFQAQILLRLNLRCADCTGRDLLLSVQLRLK